MWFPLFNIIIIIIVTLSVLLFYLILFIIIYYYILIFIIIILLYYYYYYLLLSLLYYYLLLMLYINIYPACWNCSIIWVYLNFVYYMVITFYLKLNFPYFTKKRWSLGMYIFSRLPRQLCFYQFEFYIVYIFQFWFAQHLKA